MNSVDIHLAASRLGKYTPLFIIGSSIHDNKHKYSQNISYYSGAQQGKGAAASIFQVNDGPFKLVTGLRFNRVLRFHSTQSPEYLVSITIGPRQTKYLLHKGVEAICQQATIYYAKRRLS